MMQDSVQERTERPTKRRRLDARQGGFVARSADLISAGQLFALASVMFLLGLGLLQSIVQLLQASLTGKRFHMGLQADSIEEEFRRLADWSATQFLTPLLIIMGSAILFNLIQIGPLYAPDVIRPRLSRLSPIQGLKRIFSMSSVFRLAFDTGKLLICLLVCGWYAAGQLPTIIGLTHADAAHVVMYLGQTVTRFAFVLALTYLVLSLLDVGFRRWQYERDLRMTKQELRDELKNMEGDPQIRQRRRETQRKLMQSRNRRA